MKSDQQLAVRDGSDVRPHGEAEFEEARLGVNVAAAGLGSRHSGGMNVGFRSGAVQFVSEFMGEGRGLVDLLEGTSGRDPQASSSEE